jgi:acetyl esterase/lipase
LTKKDEVMSDIEDLLLYVRSQSQALHIDASRLCIWTCSAGSPFGLRAALRLPLSTLRCIVSYYSLTDLQVDDEEPQEAGSRPDAEERSRYSAADHIRNRQGEVPPLFVARAGLDFPAVKR